MPDRFYFKVSQAAQYLGISANTLRKYTDLGLVIHSALSNCA